MDQAGKGIANHAQSHLAHAQAIIDVVEIGGKGFVETTQRPENVGTSHQASAGDGAVISRQHAAVKVTRVIFGIAVEGMAGRAVQDGNAGMLKATIRELQAGTDNADLLLL